MFSMKKVVPPWTCSQPGLWSIFSNRVVTSGNRHWCWIIQVIFWCFEVWTRQKKNKMIRVQVYFTTGHRFILAAETISSFPQLMRFFSPTSVVLGWRHKIWDIWKSNKTETFHDRMPKHQTLFLRSAHKISVYELVKVVFYFSTHKGGTGWKHKSGPNEKNKETII